MGGRGTATGLLAICTTTSDRVSASGRRAGSSLATTTGNGLLRASPVGIAARSPAAWSLSISDVSSLNGGRGSSRA